MITFGTAHSHGQGSVRSGQLLEAHFARTVTDGRQLLQHRSFQALFFVHARLRWDPAFLELPDELFTLFVPKRKRNARELSVPIHSQDEMIMKSLGAIQYATDNGLDNRRK
jgi:hypothetical protein